MPFEFLGLAFEIREMIYEEIFQNSSEDGIVTADHHHTRRARGEQGLTDHTVDSGLAILQTCRQAYGEAVPFLYGKRTFYFDDAPHRSGLVYLDPDAQCCCPVLSIKPPSHPCRGCIGCRRQLQVPVCDYTSMPDWFIAIGRQNRLMIRHIHLHFGGPVFTGFGDRLFLEEPQPNVGGEFIDDALRILAPAHQLMTLKITFASPAPDDSFGWRQIEKAFTEIFFPWASFPEARAPCIGATLSTFRGVETVTVVGGLHPGIPEDLHSSPLYKEAKRDCIDNRESVKRKMEAENDPDEKVVYEGPKYGKTTRSSLFLTIKAEQT